MQYCMAYPIRPSINIKGSKTCAKLVLGKSKYGSSTESLNSTALATHMAADRVKNSYIDP